MAKALRFYWDSCAWLGLLNGEPEKRRELQIIYDNARSEKCQLWTSALSLMEVKKLKTELQDSKPFNEGHEKTIEKMFMQRFVMVTPVDVDIANSARKLYRSTPKLGKVQDAVHICTALKWNISVLHTYDSADLLHLSGRLTCRNGESLIICYPDETTDGPLFAKATA